MAGSGGNADTVVWARALGASTEPELAEQVGQLCSRVQEAAELVDGVKASAANVPDDEITEGLAGASRSLEQAHSALQAVQHKVAS